MDRLLHSKNKSVKIGFMRHGLIQPKLFVKNREKLAKMMMPNSMAVANSNDVLPTNADGSLAMVPNSDLFYLTGIEQEQTILMMYPDAHEEKQREILFLREPLPDIETWEGHKLSKKEATEISGIKQVEWLSEFPKLFHRLMCECDHVYLNANEHKRAAIETETREARFVTDTMKRYPLHDYQRLARLLHQLRVTKSEEEIGLIQQACDITHSGFSRLLKFVKPGVGEYEVEAELAHEFIRNRAKFAYLPIIASGINACALHYISNDKICQKGDLLLLDVAASYANYNSDLTRTIPVNGKFSRRQKQIYQAVLRVFRELVKALRPGLLVRDWQKLSEQLVEKELIDLGLLSLKDVKKQNPFQPLFKKYYMHGCGHPLGLDVHDVGLTTFPMQAGWVMTVEPAIYIREEGFAVRLENDVLVTENGPVDLMGKIPIEADEIEELMN